MGSKELIQTIHRRSRAAKRLNLALVFLGPALLLILLYLALRAGLLSVALAIPLVGGALVLLVAALSSALPWFTKTRIEDAARLLDRSTNGKDRFLTLASTPSTETNRSRLNVVEKEANTIAANVRPQSIVSYRLEKSTIASVLSVPIMIGLILLLLVSKSNVSEALQQQSMTLAKELRDLAAQSPTLPSDLRSDLGTLADVLEEKGLLAPESKELLKESLSDVKELKYSGVDPQNIKPPKEENLKGSTSNPPPTPKDAKTESRSGDSQKSQESKSEQERKDSQSNSDSSKNQSLQEQPGQNSQEQDQQGQQDQQAESQEQQSSEQKGAPSESGQGGSKTDSADGNSESDQQAQSANDTGKGEQPDNEKKDSTGVGEGQGKGKSGSDKDPQGESQQGKDDSSAQQGQAKNDNQGKSGSTGPADQKSDSKQQGNNASESGEPSPGQKDSGKKDQSGSQGKSGSDIKNVEEKLNEIQKEMEQAEDGKPNDGKQGSGKQGSQDQKQGDNPGKDQQQDGQNKSGKQGSSQPKDGKGSDSKGDASDDQQGKPDKGQPNKNDSKDSQDSKSDTSSKSANQNSNSNDKQSDKASERSREGDNSNLEADPTKSVDSKKKTPLASKDSITPGNLGGEKDGAPLIGSDTERVQVEIPMDEQITVRSLGAEDGQLYRNPNEARAKTAIGDTDFEKPRPEENRAKQPIPVEYQDLMR